jgi:D-3-phosphoglycerate dehydrogenase
MNLKNYRVLVTPTSFGKHDPRLKAELENRVGEVIYNPYGRPLSSKEVASLLQGVDGYIAGLDTIDREALASADRLKVIARYGVGVDRVDLQAAHEKNIIVTNTPGANAASVAELALALILALARQMLDAFTATRLGRWPRLSGISLQGRTIGILGLGAVGKQLARRLSGFDCSIIAFDPIPDLSFADENSVILAERDEVVQQSDFLSLHLPLVPDTYHIVNEEFLGKMKPGSYLINTARGELIDEDSLLKALHTGHLGGVALDVFSQEPPDPNQPLLRHPHVIVTPHIGAQTDAATNSMGWQAMQDCLAVLMGGTPKFRVV